MVFSLSLSHILYGRVGTLLIVMSLVVRFIESQRQVQGHNYKHDGVDKLDQGSHGGCDR